MARQAPQAPQTRKKEPGTVIVVSPARKVTKDSGRASMSKTKDKSSSRHRVEKSGKSKQTVSAAGVFNKNFKENNKEQVKKKGNNLYKKFQDGIAFARSEMQGAAEQTFANVHQGLMQKLDKSVGEDNKLFDLITTQMGLLNASLYGEQFENNCRKSDGTIRTKSVTIEDQVRAYRRTIEKESSKLKELWDQWESIQAEYLELGVEIFGPQAFTEELPEDIKDGFKKEMELLDLEFETSRNELVEEVEESGPQVLEKFRNAEKGINTALQKEQFKFYQTYLPF